MATDRKIMYFGQVNVSHVICAVIISDLTAGPVNTFNLDGLAIFDGIGKGDYHHNQESGRLV